MRTKWPNLPERIAYLCNRPKNCFHEVMEKSCIGFCFISRFHEPTATMSNEQSLKKYMKKIKHKITQSTITKMGIALFMMTSIGMIGFEREHMVFLFQEPSWRDLIHEYRYYIEPFFMRHFIDYFAGLLPAEVYTIPEVFDFIIDVIFSPIGMYVIHHDAKIRGSPMLEAVKAFIMSDECHEKYDTRATTVAEIEANMKINRYVDDERDSMRALSVFMKFNPNDLANLLGAMTNLDLQGNYFGVLRAANEQHIKDTFGDISPLPAKMMEMNTLSCRGIMNTIDTPILDPNNKIFTHYLFSPKCADNFEKVPDYFTCNVPEYNKWFKDHFHIFIPGNWAEDDPNIRKVIIDNVREKYNALNVAFFVDALGSRR